MRVFTHLYLVLEKVIQQGKEQYECVIRIKQGLLSETAQRQTCCQYSNATLFPLPFHFSQGSGKFMNPCVFFKPPFHQYFITFWSYRSPIFFHYQSNFETF